MAYIGDCTLSSLSLEKTLVGIAGIATTLQAMLVYAGLPAILKLS